MPPLRDRGEDILLIADKLLKTKCLEFDKKVKDFSEDAKQCLLDNYYPGNVRDLRGIVTRALLTTKTDTIRLADLLPAITSLGTSLSHSHFADSSYFDEESSDIYTQYLPREYQKHRFITGVKNSIESSHWQGERGLHDKILISVKEASKVPLKEAVRAVSLAFERNYMIDKYITTNGKQAQAFALSEVDKKTWIEKCKTHDIKREWYVK